MKLSVLSLLILTVFNVASSVGGQCRDDQRVLLLQLRSSLEFRDESSTKLVRWNRTNDCCGWEGVECDGEGRVVGLDLSKESISDGVDDSSSLFDLGYLKVLNMSSNNFGGSSITSRIGKLVNLAHLNLSYSDFGGQIPAELSNLTRLVTLDLSTRLPHGDGLKLEDPNLAVLVRKLTELKELYLDGVNISANGKEWCEALSSSLPNLRVLSTSKCYLSGPIDSSLLKLELLENIRLDNNHFSTSIPDFFGEFRHLVSLKLSSCNFSGKLPGKVFQLPILHTLDLSNNKLLEGYAGDFPANGSLQTLILRHTNFSGRLPESMGNRDGLSRLDLSACSFTGPIPRSIQKLKQLVDVDLSLNQFNGTLPSFAMAKELQSLNVSHNKFTGEVPAQWESLQKLNFLDLSDNQIKGKLPKWIWDLGNGSLVYLNISRNLLSDFEENYSFGGKLPSLPATAAYLDYSNNNFNSSIPADLFRLTQVLLPNNFNSSTPTAAAAAATYLSLSNNNLTGTIPESVCTTASALQILDLSKNKLSGNVPGCLFERSTILSVLNLQNNKLNGSLADVFPQNCAIKTLDLSGNQIGGQVPRSLANCSDLKVLNVGHNKMHDTFPCYLKSISSLQVMVLRSNKFYGSINCVEDHRSWPMLQIVDLAINSFMGELPQDSLKTWKAMMSVGNANADYLHFKGVAYFVSTYYQDTIAFTVKGLELKLPKILTIYTAVDFSRNNFKGLIPDIMGEFRGLHILNLSHNALEGSIPSGFGNMRRLESLDLSSNQLAGEIPEEVAQLNFLSFLNLSYNELVGEIPEGHQLQTFTEESFEGNKALCGGPLRSCQANIEPPTTQYAHDDSGDDDIDTQWILLLSSGIGFVVGFWSCIGTLVLCKRWGTWYSNHVDELLFRLFPRLYRRTK